MRYVELGSPFASVHYTEQNRIIKTEICQIATQVVRYIDGFQEPGYNARHSIDNLLFIQKDPTMADATASMPIGVRIKQMREKKGWSLTELAQRAHISRSYLYQIERGASAPTEEKVRQLATALGALPSELLGEEPPTANIPESLRQFADEARLESAEVLMLAQIEYRGKKPQTKEEWRAIYAVIKGIVGE